MFICCIQIEMYSRSDPSKQLSYNKWIKNLVHVFGIHDFVLGCFVISKTSLNGMGLQNL